MELLRSIFFVYWVFISWLVRGFGCYSILPVIFTGVGRGNTYFPRVERDWGEEKFEVVQNL